MATYSSDAILTGRVHKPIIGTPGVITACAIFTITTALAQDDVVDMLLLPAGATVVGGFLRANDIDTGTEALDIDVGWAANGVDSADPDGFGNLGVWSGDAITDLRPEAGIFYPLGGVLNSTGPKTFTVETKLQLDVNVAANAGGTGKIWLIVEYMV